MTSMLLSRRSWNDLPRDAREQEEIQLAAGEELRAGLPSYSTTRTLEPEYGFNGAQERGPRVAASLWNRKAVD
jgi:hypothetical protein